ASLNPTAPPEFYTLSLHDALPIFHVARALESAAHAVDEDLVHNHREVRHVPVPVEGRGLEDIAAEHLGAASADSVELPHVTVVRSEEHTSELQSLTNLVCRLLLEK